MLIDDPHGEAAVRRQHSAQVREAAERVHGVGQKLRHDVELTSDLLGPAADRFRARMQQRFSEMHVVVRDLREFADYLSRDAQA